MARITTPHHHLPILQVPHQGREFTSQTRTVRGVVAVTGKSQNMFVSLFAALTARLIAVTADFAL